MYKKGILRIREKLAIRVLVLFNFSSFFQLTCVLGSCHYELYLVEEKCSGASSLVLEIGLYV